jgi:hypothetical protein
MRRPPVFLVLLAACAPDDAAVEAPADVAAGSAAARPTDARWSDAM